MTAQSTIAQAIDAAPFNQGVRGGDWLANPENISMLLPNGDVALFEHEGDRDYQIHVLFKSGGREAISNVRESFRRMFDEHRANLIFGLVPDFRRDVKIMARWTGMKSAGIRATTEGPCELFVLSRQMWKAN